MPFFYMLIYEPKVAHTTLCRDPCSNVPGGFAPRHCGIPQWGELGKMFIAIPLAEVSENDVKKVR